MPSPLSYAQQRMWFLEQLEPQRASANLVNGFEVLGEIDLTAWNLAIERVITSHEILCSRFVKANNQSAVRESVQAKACDVQLHKLQGTNTDQREKSWRVLVPTLARQPFDLGEPPLLRIHLAELEKNRHVLLLVMHHIISDGDFTAQAFLDKTLAQLYNSESEPTLPWSGPSEKPYQSEDLDFWRQYLDEAPQSINFPSTPGTHSSATATAITLSPELTQELHSLALANDVTLFSLLFTAYGLLLRSHTAQDTILIGWPDPARVPGNRAIGYFGQPLPVRFEASAGQSFLEVLTNTARSFQAAYSHRQTPFVEIVQEMVAERDARMPLFQTLFDLQPAIKSRQAHGLHVESRWWDTGISEYEWAMFLFENEHGGITGRIEYQPALHNTAAMDLVARRYEGLVAAMASNLQQIAYTPLTHNDQTTLRRFGLGEHLPLPSHPPHTWFESQVDLTPDAIALEFESLSITYRQLNGSANQLAHQLHRNGLKRGEIVGLFLQRSIDTITTLLALWKAGGVFLPLDPAYPKERLSFMLADSQAKLLITQNAMADELPAPETCQVVLIDDLLHEAQSQSQSNLNLDIGHDQINYIIYTSGSTGTPKGIAMVHRCLVNIIAWQLHTSKMRHELRTLQFASLNFDICFQELFTTWCAGGTVVLIDEQTRRDSKELLNYLIEQRINRLFLPFVALQQLALTAQDRPCEDLALREVLTAGEQLVSTPALRALFKKMPGCTLQNQYGPSEAHVITSFTLPTSVDQWPERPAVGHPLSNTEIALLDRDLNPVAPGAPGEVLVAGAGLAAGYLNRPEQTAVSFVQHAFGVGSPKRWYRTGDVGRFLPNGALQFIRRLDHQFKVRGFRVDLGEIEATLSQHDGVRESVVLVRGQAANAQVLAYIVPNDKQVSAPALETSQVQDWATLWDNTYQNATDSAFNLAGWTSSYTGQALAETHMRNWRDQTVSRILALQPKRVLEIGCGAGLLLTKIAPHCELYSASDFSAAVVAQLTKRVAKDPELAHKVQVTHAEALHPGVWPQGSFDTIILNSVLQLFPSADYLMRVLENALKMLSPNGRLFIGDVQNFDLLEAYHAGVATYRHRDDTWAKAHETWSANLAQEDQLMVSPRFFWSLPQTFSSIKQVKVELKHSDDCNELTKFRYDVVLDTRASSIRADTAIDVISYSNLDSLEQAKQAFTKASSNTVLIEQVPNARVQDDLYALDCLLELQASHANVAQQMDSFPNTGINPQVCLSLAESIDAHCQISWSTTKGYMDVWFSRNPNFNPPPPKITASGVTTNDPIKMRRQRSLIDSVQKHLKSRLPQYMIPSHLVVLQDLPIKASGKVDHAALPAPVSNAIRHHVRALTATETVLAKLWAETLNVNQIDADDDFFELGGHSLLAVHLLHRIRQEFAVDLPLVDLFESRTLARLAARLDAALLQAADNLEEGVL